MSVNHIKDFVRRGYIVMKQELNSAEMQTLEEVNSELLRHAQNLLEGFQKGAVDKNEFYKKNLEELIVVPESDNPLKVCRYEYIKGFNEVIREQLVPKLQNMIKELTGDDFVLFKDKLNAKNPGGGAFKPHQDVIAYHHLKPNYHVNVAIFLDKATLENGCLFFPEDYKRDLKGMNFELKKTLNGDLPILPSYVGGNNHGAIKSEVVDAMEWEPVLAEPGDVVIFDSYVPHRSEKNMSDSNRRVFFFTFNAVSFGDFYNDYYDMKHKEFDNPKFHVGTPTQHAKSDD